MQWQILHECQNVGGLEKHIISRIDVKANDPFLRWTWLGGLGLALPWSRSWKQWTWLEVIIIIIIIIIIILIMKEMMMIWRPLIMISSSFPWRWSSVITLTMIQQGECIVSSIVAWREEKSDGKTWGHPLLCQGGWNIKMVSSRCKGVQQIGELFYFCCWTPPLIAQLFIISEFPKCNVLYQTNVV